MFSLFQQPAGVILHHHPHQQNFQLQSSNSFMHTFPRNQPVQNLRTTASGIEPAPLQAVMPPPPQQLPCCSAASASIPQRRKTVTFLETLECSSRPNFENCQNLDDFPLPPPPPGHQNSSGSASTNSEEEEDSASLMTRTPTTAVASAVRSAVANNDGSNYVESRV